MAWRESAHIARLKVGKIFSGVAGAWKEGPSGKELAQIRSDYTFEQFLYPPICQLASGAAPANTDTGVIRMLFGQNYFEKTNIGTQTLFMPVMALGGIDIGGDQENNEGFAVTQGITANDKHVFTIGTSPAFFARCKFSLADVTGTDECCFGFRKVEVHRADVNLYADMATLNVVSGNINMSTIIGDAETVNTDTDDDWADNATKTLEVRVSKAGVVTYRIDDKVPTAVAAYTFTAAAVVVPFFQFLHTTDFCDTVILKEWEVGYQ